MNYYFLVEFEVLRKMVRYIVPYEHAIRSPQHAERISGRRVMEIFSEKA